MTLSWNEIKSRAQTFIKKWEDGHREEADAKEFLIDFLNIFGVSRKKVATFEHKVKKLSEADGYIDLLWKGQLLVEMKSRGKDLEKAYMQAKDYCAGLQDYELPRQIIISDFERFDVYDENGSKTSFTLNSLLQNIQVFGNIAGYEKRIYKEQDIVNIDAAERMGKLHDKLKAAGYVGHELEVYLVRLVFCMFADDTNIFEKNTFLDFIEKRTSEDGSDLAPRIAQLFQVLNTPNEKRNKNLDEMLNAFPYVNGKLFETQLSMPEFDSDMRKNLIHCCGLHWGKISPAIFGSLFQSVMDEKARRNLGAHYTSEKNIMKLIQPLFLDELQAQFQKNKKDKKALQKLHERISKLKFLDPACGCGNFLIISYRELRLLELEIVKLLLKNEWQSTQQLISINTYFLVDVDQFYGIEYEDFPSQIAQVAMWLIDHQMNEMASLAFGEYYKRIPLKKSATIVHGNALRMDWQSLIDPLPWEKGVQKFDYILGNPPFIGKHLMNANQKSDMDLTFKEVNGGGVLDYVTAWYIKAATYMQSYTGKDTTILTKTAFVSTNSIAQGEQVGVLWSELFKKFNIKIHFAHRTFSWSNEARGNAAV
ncbi:MAG: DNA methyltransferase, partial [Ferruginibacter sp.]